MTDALLAWQTETFRDTRATPAERVLLRPELVVEIELDGVQRNNRYPGGVALRFRAGRSGQPPNKTAADADTIDAVRALLPPRAPGGGIMS